MNPWVAHCPPESLLLGTAILSCVLGPSASTPVLVILLVYQAACLTCFSLDMLGERQSQLINSGCIIKIKNNNTEKGLLSDTHLLRGCLQALLLCFFYGRNTVEKGDNPVFPRDVHISLTKMFPKLPRLEYFYQHHVQQQSRNLYLAKQCTGKTQNNIKHTHCKGKWLREMLCDFKSYRYNEFGWIREGYWDEVNQRSYIPGLVEKRRDLFNYSFPISFADSFSHV